MRRILFLFLPLALFGQMRDNRDKQLTCNDGGYGAQVHRCEMREQTMAKPPLLTADAGLNGGIFVRGWTGKDVLVRARVEAWADNAAMADAMLRETQVNSSAGRISATGPSANRRSGWAVSYEIFIPRKSDIDLRAFNGAIELSDVEGTARMETTNGRLRIARVAGDVNGITQNGSLDIELMGKRWEGRRLDVQTTNGQVRVTVPDGYSAQLQAQTVNGQIYCNFPVTVTGRIGRMRDLNATLGSGGALIHVSTINGPVSLSRI